MSAGDKRPSKDDAGEKASNASGGSNVAPLRPRRPCPECGKPSARETYPFCSTRCKNVDLNRWLSGAYVIPARKDDEEGDEKRKEQE